MIVRYSPPDGTLTSALLKLALAPAASERVGAASAGAAGIVTDLGVALKVTTEHSIVRLGSIQARLQPRIAAAGMSVATP